MFNFINMVSSKVEGPPLLNYKTAHAGWSVLGKLWAILDNSGQAEGLWKVLEKQRS